MNIINACKKIVSDNATQTIDGANIEPSVAASILSVYGKLSTANLAKLLAGSIDAIALTCMMATFKTV